MRFKPPKYEKPFELVNRLRTIFYIMVGIPLALFLSIYFPNRLDTLQQSGQDLPVFWLAVMPACCLLATALAYLNYYKKLKKLRKESAIKTQIDRFFSAKVEKFIYLEGITLLVLCVYFFNHHALYAGLYMLMLILFAMNNPTIFSLIDALRLPLEKAAALRENQPLVQKSEPPNK